MKLQKIYLGSDHAGFATKEKLKAYLDQKQISYEDLGAYSKDPVDYPDYALKVALKVVKDENSKGILICGTGTGMAIAANKVKGARAVAAYDEYSAEMSRKDNDTNILCLREREFPFKKTKKIIDIWLQTPFSKEARHQERLNKIKGMES